MPRYAWVGLLHITLFTLTSEKCLLVYVCFSETVYVNCVVQAIIDEPSRQWQEDELPSITS